MSWPSPSLFDDLSAEERTTLEQFGFECEPFLQRRQDLLEGHFAPEHNRTTLPVAAPTLEQFSPTPHEHTEQWQACVHVGKQVLGRGLVANVILNGGMATRFGGAVKGIVDITPDRSFLAYKLQSLRDGHGPIFIMNSFATDAATQAHCRAHRYFGIDPQRIVFCHQGIAIRLYPDGRLFRANQPLGALYAPGHADVLQAVRQTPQFHRFVATGGRCLFVSNVDNIGAYADACSVGLHVQSQKPITAEVVPTTAGDKGGAPVWHGQSLEILEQLRLPSDFAQTSLPAFSTNSFLLDARCFLEDKPLRYFRVDKHVENQTVVQFERLIGEITAFYPTHYLLVPRTGPRTRFFPVKTLADLDALRAYLLATPGWPAAVL